MMRHFRSRFQQRIYKPKAYLSGIMAKGTGTILLIEDEDVVIDVIIAMLERLGYNVLLAKQERRPSTLPIALMGILIWLFWMLYYLIWRAKRSTETSWKLGQI